MLISLDTNVWVFGLTKLDLECEKILQNLKAFQVIIPDQIRAELERNLNSEDLKAFYTIAQQYDTIDIDFAKVPQKRIEKYKKKGLKKGDTEIAAFCEWRVVKIIVSDNRDFLTLMRKDLPFEIISPAAFCKKFNL
jgi:predicted nucleic acid-binding protein